MSGLSDSGRCRAAGPSATRRASRERTAQPARHRQYSNNKDYCQEVDLQRLDLNNARHGLDGTGDLGRDFEPARKLYLNFGPLL